MLSPLTAAVTVLLEIALTRDRAAAMRRLAVAGLCTVLAIVCTVVALACAVAALWIYVLPYLGPAGAPLVVAGGLFAVAVVLFIVSSLALRRRRAPTPRPAALDAIVAEVTQVLHEHKGATLMAAVIAGLAAGSKSGGR